MIGILVDGVLQTQPSFILTAATVCSAMAGTLLMLFKNAEASRNRRRLVWMTMIAIVAGVGVWTTHFVAMIGYRPDAALAYDTSITLASIVVGVILTGVPLALTCLTSDRRRRAGLGALAGLGVAAMHMTGMSALMGCVTRYDPLLLGVAVASGVACFAGALSVRTDGATGEVAKAAGIVGGICSLHFLAMSSLSLEVVATYAVGTSRSILMLMVTVAFAALCIVAVNAAYARRKLLQQRRLADEAAARQHEAFATALSNMSNGLVMIGTDDAITAINPQTFAQFDISSEGIEVGTPFALLLERIAARHGWKIGHVAAKFEDYLRGADAGRVAQSEEELSDGRVLHVSCRRVREGGTVLTFDDVTERRHAQAEIAYIAYHDTLTHLPNRRAFREHLRENQGAGRAQALLLLDLDHFKNVNDTLGHPVGDALLVQVAERLRRALDDRGTAFRLGGDEMALVLAGDHAEAAGEVARRVVAGIGRPFEIDGHTISSGCSVGMYVTAEKEDPSDLLRKADLALYRAKLSGRHRVEVYEEGMQEKVRARRQREIDMAQALASGDFTLNYQPLFRLPDRRIVGFEALIRWPHSEHGPISPADFIPLAEETGMIVDIGAWVLDEACRQLSLWPDDLMMAVNVSAVQMRLPSLVDTVTSTLAKHGLDPRRLKLELTETAIMTDGKRLSANISALRKLGVQVAMDDFGTGYSSLAHLCEFELDEIKIDRSFINVASDNREAWAVTNAIVGMARGLSVDTVGEGVETQEQLAHLMHLGCNVAQGFFLSRPLSADQVEAFLATNASETSAKTCAIARRG